MLAVDENDGDSVKALAALYQRLVKSDVKVISPFTGQTVGGKMGQIVDAYGITWILREQPMTPPLETATITNQIN